MKTYLALGDSYTIGEGVTREQSFPFQLAELLRKATVQIAEPEIIAKTGWTTRELIGAIEHANSKTNYDLVTLLIGVNNQYRELSLEEYKIEFDSLLKTAIGFAGDNPGNVYVISIPDWSATPFSADRDRYTIRKEIDGFNSANHLISERYQVAYIDITIGSRDALHNPKLVTGDKLHPSFREYARWASKLSKKILNKPDWQ